MEKSDRLIFISHLTRRHITFGAIKNVNISGNLWARFNRGISRSKPLVWYFYGRLYLRKGLFYLPNCFCREPKKNRWVFRRSWKAPEVTLGAIPDIRERVKHSLDVFYGPSTALICAWVYQSFYSFYYKHFHCSVALFKQQLRDGKKYDRVGCKLTRYCPALDSDSIHANCRKRLIPSPLFPLLYGRVLTKCSILEGELITALSCRCNNSQLAYKTSCLFLRLTTIFLPLLKRRRCWVLFFWNPENVFGRYLIAPSKIKEWALYGRTER